MKGIKVNACCGCPNATVWADGGGSLVDCLEKGGPRGFETTLNFIHPDCPLPDWPEMNKNKKEEV